MHPLIKEAEAIFSLWPQDKQELFLKCVDKKDWTEWKEHLNDNNDLEGDEKGGEIQTFNFKSAEESEEFLKSRINQ